MARKGPKPLSFATPQAWLEHYAVPVPESGCWLFTGCALPSGYGHMGRYVARGKYGTTTVAHRAAWRVFYGPIPEGMLVCHSCDVRLCVNPKHLFLGTQADNIHDMMRKGRGRPPPKKSHCVHGHEFTVENTYTSGRSRQCVECTRIRGARRYIPVPPITHCKQGHEFSPENTGLVRGKNHRNCRACKKIWNAEQYQKRKALTAMASVP